MMIYLDNAATSPVDEEVLDAMLPYLREEYGNPSSKYYCKADNAKQAVEDARAKVAFLFGATSEEIEAQVARPLERYISTTTLLCHCSQPTTKLTEVIWLHL